MHHQEKNAVIKNLSFFTIKVFVSCEQLISCHLQVSNIKLAYQEVGNASNLQGMHVLAAITAFNTWVYVRH